MTWSEWTEPRGKRVTGGVLPEEVMFESTFESRRRSWSWKDLGKADPGKGAARAKAPRQEHNQGNWGTARKPLMLRPRRRGAPRKGGWWQAEQGLKTVIRALDPDLGAEGSCQGVLTPFCISPQPFFTFCSSAFAWLLEWCLFQWSRMDVRVGL